MPQINQSQVKRKISSLSCVNQRIPSLNLWIQRAKRSSKISSCQEMGGRCLCGYHQQSVLHEFMQCYGNKIIHEISESKEAKFKYLSISCNRVLKKIACIEVK